MRFPHLRRWRKATFMGPCITHQGVRVYHVLHRQGWPLDYHFSWQQTRVDGDRCLPHEIFDIRKLPDFFERPGLCGIPNGATVAQWRRQHWADHEDQIRWFIDECSSKGIAPWAAFKKPLIPWATFIEALRRDVQNSWNYHFPGPEERDRRKGETWLGTHLSVALIAPDTFAVEIEGAHWKQAWGHPIAQEYTCTASADSILMQYLLHVEQLFRTKVQVRSAQLVPAIGTKLTAEHLSEWAKSFADVLDLELTEINPIPQDLGGGTLLRAADSPENLTRTLDFCGYLIATK